MTVIYYMSIDRADKPWIGDRRLTESIDPQQRPAGPGFPVKRPIRKQALRPALNCDM